MNGIEIVNEIMKQKGVTRAALAERLGYAHPSGVSERLRGLQDMRADTLAKFLEALDCELIVRSKRNDGTEWTITGQE